MKCRCGADMTPRSKMCPTCRKAWDKACAYLRRYIFLGLIDPPDKVACHCGRKLVRPYPIAADQPLTVVWRCKLHCHPTMLPGDDSRQLIKRISGS